MISWRRPFLQAETSACSRSKIFSCSRLLSGLRFSRCTSSTSPPRDPALEWGSERFVFGNEFSPTKRWILLWWGACAPSPTPGFWRRTGLKGGGAGERPRAARDVALVAHLAGRGKFFSIIDEDKEISIIPLDQTAVHVCGD